MWIPSDLLTTVCFLAVEDRGKKIYGGTAFLVSVEESDCPDWNRAYLVTAKHCVLQASEKYRELFCRVNTKSGGTKFVPLPLCDSGRWFMSDAADVAVLPFEEDDTIEMTTFPSTIFLTDTLMKRESIGPGDEVFMLGLFQAVHGKERNVPIVRSGMISSLLENEPLQDAYTNEDYRAFLIEARSIGGLSGSPVLMALKKSGAEMRPAPRGYNPWIHSLIVVGLIRGHWDLNEKAEFVDFGTGTMERLNTGIAIVTPMQEVERVLMSDGVRKARRADLREHLKNQN